MIIPSLQSGGMERVMVELLGYLSKYKKARVHLILYGINREIFYQLPEGVHLHLPNFKFNNRFRFYYSLRTLFFLRKEVKSIEPTSILSFGEYWNNFVLLALIGINIPKYVSDRCQPDKSLGYFHDHLRKILYPRANSVIIQSSKAKEIYEKNLPGTTLNVIGNPIRTIDRGNTATKENMVLSVGRLVKSKNLDKLIQIFIELEQPSWQLIIVGDDALKQDQKIKLNRIIESAHVENRVKLVGQIKEVEKFYVKAKIFAFTSESEGFPNVIGEAQSAGLPVVSFDCIAGPSELINDGVNGFLVPLHNYKLFKQRLLNLINSEELRANLGNRAGDSIKAFSTKNIGEQYYRLLIGA